MQTRFSLPGGAILLGFVLMVASTVGMLFNLSLPASAGALPYWADDLPAWVAPDTGGSLSTLPDITRVLPTPLPPTARPADASAPLAAGAGSAPAPTGTPTLLPEATVAENAFLVQPPPTLEAQPTAEAQPAGLPPDRLVIPAIALDAPVVASSYQLVQMEGELFQQWEAPPYYAAGWQNTSAMLGVPGNTVFNGHNNINGLVFAGLEALVEGDIIQVYAGGTEFNYEVIAKMILLERDQPLAVRLENAVWLQPTEDERLTLVTCWPDYSNTHRLIVVAAPVR